MPSQSLSSTAPRMEVTEWEKELEAMPGEEKAKAMRDLYGKAKPIDETPELVSSALEELAGHLSEEQHDKEAFLEAQERIPELVDSVDFRLMFLRATQFNAKAAANRMVKYWKFKVSLFGADVAFRQGGRVLLTDLSEDDLATLDALGLFWLPNDEAGRGVLFSRRQEWSSRGRSNLTRLAWYLVQVALEDVSVQKNGVVAVIYNVGDFSIVDHFDRKGTNLLLQVAFHALPMRVAGVHHCFTSKVYEIILPFTLFFFGPEIRARHRLHPDVDNIVKELVECGLTIDALPTLMGGNLDLDVVGWKRERMAFENVE